MQRRVVVTGIGLICAVGNTAPEAWKNLLAGKSGMAPITQFDATGYPVTFAAEVKDFDPLNFVEKKVYAHRNDLHSTNDHAAVLRKCHLARAHA